MQHARDADSEDTDVQPAKKMRIIPSDDDGSDTCTELERDVGIKYRANRGLPRFEAVLKNLSFDFVVRELREDGSIVRITDLGESLLQKKEKGSPSDSDSKGKSKSEEGMKLLREIMMKEKEASTDDETEIEAKVAEVNGILEQFSELLSKKRNEPVVFTPMESKDDRKNVHMILREHFQGLVSSVVVDAEGKHISVKRGKDKARNQWPAGEPDYLEFVLAKEHMNLSDALAIIARKCGMNQKSFSFAGTKDKRSVSTQRITVRRVLAEKMAKLNSSLRQIAIGNFRYVKETLGLGQAGGNHFTITLRHVSFGESVYSDAEKDKIINDIFEALKKNGSINYYGHQRFGASVAGATHLIGIKILTGDYRGAVDLMMRPREHEKDEDRKARLVWGESDRNAAETLRYFPKYIRLERQVLQDIVHYEKTHPNATLHQQKEQKYREALEKMPRMSAMMYLHGFQSLLWNEMASERARLHGIDRVVPGDLVLVKDSHDAVVDVDVDMDFDVDVDADVHEGKLKVLESLVHVVTDEEDASRYSIESVVIPVPGQGTKMPCNGTEAVCNRILEENSLTPPQCWGNPKFKGMKLLGDYRRFLLKPSDLEWKIVKYRDYSIPLVEFDKEPVLTKSRLDLKVEGEGKGEDHTAVVVTFSLPPGSYATILLREVLAGDLAQPSLRKSAQSAGIGK